MKEARIGSLPWFAGVFWLVGSGMSLALGRVSFQVGDRLHWLHKPAWWLTWRLTWAAEFCNRLALRCAIEAGAEVE